MQPYYERDGITIYCGKWEDVLPTLPAGSVDLVVTSPPYNLGKKTWDMGGEGRRKRPDGIGYADALPQSVYESGQVALLCALWRVVAAGGSLFYNHKPRTLSGRAIHPAAWLLRSDHPWILRQELIWDRGSTHNHEPRLFWQEDERVYWMTKGRPGLPAPIRQSSIWRIAPDLDNDHPAPFPLGLPTRIIGAVTSGTVLDPYAGSGTTLRAARNLGRKAIGIEVNEVYCQQAIERLQQAVLPLEVA